MAYSDPYEEWKAQGRPGGSFQAWQAGQAAPAPQVQAQPYAAPAPQPYAAPAQQPGTLDINQFRNTAAQTGASEDWTRFQQGDLDRWAQYYDPASGKFRSSRGAPGLYDKPTECPPGQGPSGPNETDPCTSVGYGGDGGGGGGGGGVSSGMGTGTAGEAPLFNAPRFTAPGLEEMYADPGYQARLREGQQRLEHSQAAKGMARTGGSLLDLLRYGQDYAANEYANTYGRAANTYGLNYQAAKDEFAPQYGAWQTKYGGDLSRWTTGQNVDLSRWTTGQNNALQKYLLKENQIYGMMNLPMPTWGG